MIKFINWLLKEHVSNTSVTDSLKSEPELIRNLKQVSEQKSKEKYQLTLQRAQECRERLIKEVKSKAIAAAEEGYDSFWMTIYEYHGGQDFTELSLREIRKVGFKVVRGSEYGTTSYWIGW